MYYDIYQMRMILFLDLLARTQTEFTDDTALSVGAHTSRTSAVTAPTPHEQ